MGGERRRALFGLVGNRVDIIIPGSGSSRSSEKKHD